jgi:type IV pilus assembly protein PilY1
MDHCEDLPGNIVVFGTGKFLGREDLTDATQQTVYGIWDFGDDTDDDEYLGTFQAPSGTGAGGVSNVNNVELHQQLVTEIGSSASYTAETYELNWETESDADAGEGDNPSTTASDPAANVGWFLNLLNRERVFNKMTIRDGRAIFVTSTPEGFDQPCSAGGGSSRLLQLNACTGSAPTIPIIDVNDDMTINEDDLIDGQVVVGPPMYDQLVFPPVIISDPANGGEILILSSAGGPPGGGGGGDPEVERQVATGTGLIYWRQIH